MTDVPYEATTCDQAAAFFRALSGSVRVAVYKPNAGREWDVSTFDPAAIKADISAKDAEIARLRDEIRSAERAAAHAAYSLIATLIRSGTPLDGIRFIADSSAEALSPEGTSE